MQKKKIYVRRYYIDEDKRNEIAVKWKTGMNYFEIHENDNKLKELNGSSEILKGVLVDSKNYGTLFVKMVLKPHGFEVKTGDRYLFGSRIESEDKLVTTSTIFYIISFLFFAGFVLSGFFRENADPTSIDAIVFASLGVVYAVCGVFVRKGFLTAYVVGVVALLANIILQVIVGSIPALLIVLLVIVALQTKNMIDLFKHRKALSQYLTKANHPDILDNF